MTPPARSLPVTGTGAVLAGRGAYLGFTFRETGGTTTAVVKVFDNASAASGTLLDTIAVPASTSARQWYGPQGKFAENGVYVSVSGGTVEGSVSIG